MFAFSENGVEPAKIIISSDTSLMFKQPQSRENIWVLLNKWK